MGGVLAGSYGILCSDIPAHCKEVSVHHTQIECPSTHYFVCALHTNDALCAYCISYSNECGRHTQTIVVCTL